jgi:predicted permease
VGARVLADLRSAIRLCLRDRAFTAVAALTLGLAIGTASGVFSLVDAVLLRPLPVRAPSELVAVLSPGAGGGGLSYPDFLDYREEGEALSDLAAYTWSTVGVEDGGSVREAEAFLVSEDYFAVLGVGAAQGRVFHAGGGGGTVTGASGHGAREVVLSHDAWRAWFDAAPNASGRVLTVKGEPYTIVGVAPESFTGTVRGYRPDLWMPLRTQQPTVTLENRAARGLVGLGRLRAGVSVAAAQSRLALVAQRLAAAHPASNRGVGVRVTPERDAFLPDARPVRLLKQVFVGLFALVFGIACMNLACLLLARGLFRQREIAIRASLGASRRDIVQQLLTESLVLSILGGAVGLGVAVLLRDVVWGWAGSIVAGAIGQRGLGIDTGLDLRTFGFTLALALVSVVLFGLFPAWRVSAFDVYGVVKPGASTTPPQVNQRPVRLLVTGQVALSTVLLVCAGLFLRTLHSAWRPDPGHPTKDVYVARIDPGAVGYDERRTQAFYRSLLGRLERRVEIETASLGAAGWPDYLPARAFPERDRHVVYGPVSPGSFRTLRVPVLAGRDFTEADTATAVPVAIVNQLLAARLWPGENAVGKPLPVSESRPPLTVVGLVQTINNPIGPPFPMLYVPLAQHEHWRTTLSIRARPGFSPAAALVDEVRALDPALPPVHVQSLEGQLAQAWSAVRLGSTVLGWLGSMALLLAAVGLSGLTGYVVSERTREVGIRKALGASAAQVLALVVGGTLRLVVLGLAVGFALSLGAAQVVKALLVGSALDPFVLLGVPVVLAATAGIAAYVPARRALALDPMTALRCE